MRRITADELEGLVRRSLEALGVSAHDARVAAEALVFADLRGISSHGVRRLPNYLERARHGLTTDSRGVREVTGRGPLRRLDAAHALGPPAAVHATDLACDLADEHGFGLVALGRATHFGAAGFYALRIAQRGLAGLVLSNAPRAVAPHGAREPFLGTNPVALAVPLGRHGRLLLDMSTSAVPKAQIRRALEAGERLEPNWALDAEGRPTTDPAAALAGAVLPLGGPKGSGLAFAITLIAGILAEGGFDDEMPSIYSDFEQPQVLGQVFAALDPLVLTSPAEAMRRVESLVDRLHDLPPAQGFDRVRHAGEGGDARAAERARDGIPVPTRDLSAIADACATGGLDLLSEEWRSLGA